MTSATVVPPQNEDAELSVLGAMLTSQNAVAVASEHVGAADFYFPSHGTIFEAAIKLYMTGSPVDAVTVIDELDKADALERIGGRRRIHELANDVTATANVGHYARIVREMAQLRDLISTGQQITALGQERPGETRDLIDQAEQLIYGLAQEHTPGDLEAIHVSLKETYDQIATRGLTPVTGIASGFTALDTLTTGMHAGNLIVLAARPSMGKTALALAIGSHVAVDLAQPVALFTLEMNKTEVNQRLLALRSGVNLQALRTGRLERQDHTFLLAASEELASAPFYTDDSAEIRALDIRSKARRMKSRHGLSLVIVDYLQLMVGEARPENRAQEVSQISRALKMVARDLAVPVLALSQLNRGLEMRHDKRPMLSDLRESGSIEQDADIVLFVYRDSVYHKDAPEAEAELIVAKQRNGALETIQLDWVKKRAEFRNLR